jgi:hypothetical protein
LPKEEELPEMFIKGVCKFYLREKNAHKKAKKQDDIGNSVYTPALTMSGLVEGARTPSTWTTTTIMDGCNLDPFFSGRDAQTLVLGLKLDCTALSREIESNSGFQYEYE